MPPMEQQGQKTGNAAREPGVGGCSEVFYDSQESPATELYLNGPVQCEQPGTITTNRGQCTGTDSAGIPPSCRSRQNTEGTEPSNFGGARPKTNTVRRDKSDCPELQQNPSKSSATQVYLKTQRRWNTLQIHHRFQRYRKGIL